MAKVINSVLGNVRGKIGDLVGGAARDAYGKVSTLRVWARPTNPNTAAQALQRNKFKASVQMTRNLGPSFYQTDWNRATGQLPGFQSLVGIFTDATDDTLTLTAPADTPLGTLHQPATITIAQGISTNEVDFTWTTEVGQNGDAADEVVLFAIRADDDTDGRYVTFEDDTSYTRTDGSGSLDMNEDDIAYVCGIYLRGTLGEPQGLSVCAWASVQTGT